MDEKPKQTIRQRLKGLGRGKIIMICAILLLMIGGGGWFGYLEYKYESTDDAYVGANSTQLSAKVAAIVTYVLVQENQRVKAGQIIAQLDRKDYQAALDNADATLGALEARLKDADQDYRRYRRLLKAGAITRQQFDHALANYLDIQRQTSASQSQVDEAKLNLDFTSIRAPSDGQIARRSVDVGMYVSPGTALFGFVPFDERWVDANFKETQLPSVAIGKQAEVTVDAVPGRKYQGVVESISPATGSTFTLLPPDNATGNFTKVVQRVPVRIVLKNLKPDDFLLLQAGLSANVDLLKHSAPQSVPEMGRPVFLSGEIHSPMPPIFEPQAKPPAPGGPGGVTGQAGIAGGR